MKKLLIIAFLSTLNVCAQDPIEKAILEGNSSMLEGLLVQKESLSVIDKIRYLDLAQQAIDEQNTDTAIKKMNGDFGLSLVTMGVLGVIVVPWVIADHFLCQGYSFKRDGLKPIVLSTLSGLAVLFCLIVGDGIATTTREARKQKLKDVLNNKQLIYKKI